MALTCEATCKKCGERCGAPVKNKRANAIKQLTDGIEFIDKVLANPIKNMSTSHKMRLILQRGELVKTLAKFQGDKRRKETALLEKKLKQSKGEVEKIIPVDNTPLNPEAERFFNQIEDKKPDGEQQGSASVPRGL